MRPNFHLKTKLSNGDQTVIWRLTCHLEAILSPGGQTATWRPNCHLEVKLSPGSQTVTWRPNCHLEAKLSPGGKTVTWRPNCHLEAKLLPWGQTVNFKGFRTSKKGGRQHCFKNTPGNHQNKRGYNLVCLKPHQDFEYFRYFKSTFIFEKIWAVVPSRNASLQHFFWKCNQNFAKFAENSSLKLLYQVNFTSRE